MYIKKVNVPNAKKDHVEVPVKQWNEIHHLFLNFQNFLSISKIWGIPEIRNYTTHAPGIA